LIENRRDERPVLMIDAGDFCSTGIQRDKELTNKYFFQAMKELRYDALVIGEKEILFGKRNLLETARRSKLPLVSSNILDKKTKRQIGAPHIVRTIGGTRLVFKTVGGVKVGIFGVTAPDLVYATDRLAREYYEVIDPRIAALEAVSQLRGKGCEVIIALSHQPWEESTGLAREVDGIDVVVSSHGGGLKTLSDRLGTALIVQTGDNTRSFTEIEVGWRNGRPEAVAVDRGDTLLKLEDHPDFAEIEREFQREKNPRIVNPRRARDEIQVEKRPAEDSADE
jgi:5'-nucleotidase/UDP-sugar diphosphatase